MSKIVELPRPGRRGPVVPHAPEHVTGLAAEEWARVAAVLVERGDLDPAVLGTLEAYAINYARWREAEDHVAEHGIQVSAPRTGLPIDNPYLAVSNRAAALMLKMAKALRVLP